MPVPRFPEMGNVNGRLPDYDVQPKTARTIEGVGRRGAVLLFLRRGCLDGRLPVAPPSRRTLSGCKFQSSPAEGEGRVVRLAGALRRVGRLVGAVLHTFTTLLPRCIQAHSTRRLRSDMEGTPGVQLRVVAALGTSFYVQQRDERDWQWRTVTIADTRSAADPLAEELRRALEESPYSPVAPVRVVSDVELAQEKRIAIAARAVLRRAGQRP